MTHLARVFFIFMIGIIFIGLSDKLVSSTVAPILEYDEETSVEPLNSNPGDYQLGLLTDDELMKLYFTLKNLLSSTQHDFNAKSKRDDKKRNRLGNVYRFNPQTSN